MALQRICHPLLPVLALLAAAIGCNNNTTYPPTVSSVEVTPGTATLTALGLTRQFTAVVKDQFGNTMADKTVEWRSTLPSVATVDPTTGLATATGNGVSMITATVDFFTGSAVLTVTQQATKLIFLAVPFGGTAGRTLSPAVKVEIEDAAGARVATATDAVTLTFGANPSGAVFVGTTLVAAVGGVATFSGLAIDKAGANFTLVASAANLTGITSTPFTLAPSHGPFAQVSPGFMHTCGVTVAGATYCWGGNFNGELGDGTTISRPNPERVAGSVAFIQVSAGANQTCGVTAAGAAYCWGANTYGQIGDGTTTDRSSPVPVAPSVTFAAVSTGFYHTCGVTTAGAVYCWGYNANGQLGDGTTTDHAIPMLVSGSVTFAAVSARSAGHTCGVTAAGAAYCWGDNSLGAVGDGTGIDRSIPLLVADTLTFAAVSVGEFHTCGRTAGSAVYCWGSNFAGQLGDGNTPTRDTSPVLVVGGVSFTAVSPGGDHTCGVTATNAAYCWGYNNLGQLGDGTMTDRSTPTPVSGSVSFAQVSAGVTHTCGITPAGAAYCWGVNFAGQLGDGTTTGRTMPVPVGP